MAELRASSEQDKLQLMRESHKEKDKLMREMEREKVIKSFQYAMIDSIIRGIMWSLFCNTNTYRISALLDVNNSNN